MQRIAYRNTSSLCRVLWLSTTRSARMTMMTSSRSMSVATQPVKPKAPEHVPVLKRFWKQVHVVEADGQLTIMLDKRVLKTPEGRPMVVPNSKRALAAAIAQEWEAQDKVVKHHALPVTSIVCQAIDAYADSGARIDKAVDLLRYLNTDTICFQEVHPPSLVTLQQKHWDPLFTWVQSTFSVPLNIYGAIMRPSQPTETRNAFQAVLNEMNALELAAMERATYYSKSFVIALALAKGAVSAEEASLASLVEVNSQIARWGEVEDTHDVDHRDIRRHLAAAALVFSKI